MENFENWAEKPNDESVFIAQVIEIAQRITPEQRFDAFIALKAVANGERIDVW